MTFDQQAAREPVIISTASDKLPSVPHPHSQKFRVALAMLCAVGLGAIAVAVALLAHGGSRPATAAAARWSPWAPTSSGAEGVTQIADHVAPYYRISASQQFDAVTPISVSEATAAGTTTGKGLTVVVNTAPSGKSQSLSLLNGKTIAYNICGLGPKKCQLPGTPSTDRMLLMRREALELALYTFKYITGSENVLAVLPPGRTVSTGPTAVGVSAPSSGKPITVSVLFLRKELQPWLNVPLAKTLQQYPPEESELTLWSKTEEAGLVDQITANGLFSSQVESQQEGGNLLVLNPLPPQ